MPLIFLSENNSLTKKVLKNPFSKKDVSLFEIPLKKMRKRARASFRERVLATDALFLSDPSLNFLLPERNTDIKAFFDSVIADVLSCVLRRKNLLSNRLVIINPTESLILSAIDVFPDIALSGEGALSLASRICKMTGLSIPIVSGYTDGDNVLCSRSSYTHPSKFLAGFDIEKRENSLTGSDLKFYPVGEYSPVTALINRPLTIYEAAFLSEYDKKASFNIVF